MLGIPAELSEFAEQCITSYQMNLPFLLAHPVGGEGDEDCIVF